VKKIQKSISSPHSTSNHLDPSNIEDISNKTDSPEEEEKCNEEEEEEEGGK
jgi:hypothetical protein